MSKSCCDCWLFEMIIDFLKKLLPRGQFVVSRWLLDFFPIFFDFFSPLYWLSRGLFSNFSPFRQFFTRLSSAPLWSSSAPSVRSWSSLAPFAWVFQFICFFALPPSTRGFVSDVDDYMRLFYPSLVRVPLFGAGPRVPVGLCVDWLFPHFCQNARKPKKPTLSTFPQLPRF